MRGSSIRQRKHSFLPLTLTLSPRKSGERGLTPLRTVRTTCPYCGVGCGVLATPDGKGGAAIRGDPEHPANFGRLCSKGSALGETLGLETRLLHPIVDGARASWDARARPRRQAPAGHPRRARARGDRLLPLGPAADRGLLRRQQAGERLHRHAARRHQLAPVHGLLGRRPSPRLRRRRGAAVLRGPGACRPRRAGGLQCRLVPPDPLPAHPDGAGRARRARRQHRPAAHRHQRGRRPAALPAARHATAILWSRPAGVAGRAPADRPRRSSQRTRKASPAALAARPRASRRRSMPSPARRVSTAVRHRAVLRLVRRHPARASPATARASTSRRRAPTRSTPSSTATWPPAASASRAPDRSRSPASPTPWAGARSAGLANMLAAHMGFSAERARPRAPLLEGAQRRRRRGPQGRRTCSMPSPTAASRRCG